MPQMMASSGSHALAPTQDITRLDGTARAAYPANRIPAQRVTESNAFYFCMQCSSGFAECLQWYWNLLLSLSSVVNLPEAKPYD